MNNDTTLHAKDLTQLSSREQLSALMDGALPPDETRFLLRRLQHDAPLAACWERWRLAGEVMRGLAPAQRLPADFAGRVASALHGDEVSPPRVASAPIPAWLRWGGGAAIAASLAVALVVRLPAPDAAVAPAAVASASAAPAAPPAPSPVASQQPPVGASGEAQALAAAAALAATARPTRARGVPAASPGRSVEAAPELLASTDSAPLLAQPEIVARPWPRSVLPQYAGDGLTVGFGNQLIGQQSHNPFQGAGVMGRIPADPAAVVQSPATAGSPEPEPASDPQPQP